MMHSCEIGAWSDKETMYSFDVGALSDKEMRHSFEVRTWSDKEMKCSDDIRTWSDRELMHSFKETLSVYSVLLITRPPAFPVGLPSVQTCTPFTHTCFMPSEIL